MLRNEFTKLMSIRTKTPIDTVNKVIEGIENLVTEMLSKGIAIQLTGFGTFTYRLSDERVCRNPRTGEMVTVPPTCYPVFKAGEKLREALKSNSIISTFTEPEDEDDEFEQDEAVLDMDFSDINDIESKFKSFTKPALSKAS